MKHKFPKGNTNGWLVQVKRQFGGHGKLTFLEWKSGMLSYSLFPTIFDTRDSAEMAIAQTIQLRKAAYDQSCPEMLSKQNYKITPLGSNKYVFDADGNLGITETPYMEFAK